MPNTKSWEEYQNETNIFVAEPNTRATNSWITLNDIPDENKATLLFFNVLEEEKAKVYMTYVRKDDQTYVKLYIILYGVVNVLYVEKHAVSQGERITRNQKVSL